jgi:hypothetical protein
LTVTVPPLAFTLETGGVTLLAFVLGLLLEFGLETLLAVVELVFGVLTLEFGLLTLLAVVLGTVFAPLGLETLLALVVTPVGAAWLGAWRVLLVLGWLEGAGVVWVVVVPRAGLEGVVLVVVPRVGLETLGVWGWLGLWLVLGWVDSRQSK